jgi:hypothetical protein
MHYHPALVQLFASTFGARFLRLFKPSTRLEAWLGFDQGWVCTEMSEAAFLQELRESITSSEAAPSFFVAYFLQFKTVQRMTRRSRSCPSTFDTPYFRSELSLEPNPTTGLSQHETLLRLSTLARADVNYACAMMLTPDDVYEPPDLDRLRIVPASSSPSGWATNERHYVCFQTEADDHPIWMSEPHEGHAMSASGWVRRDGLQRKLRPRELQEFLANAQRALTGNFSKRVEGLEHYPRKPLPQCLTILEFEEVSEGSA